MKTMPSVLDIGSKYRFIIRPDWREEERASLWGNLERGSLRRASSHS